jgi:hypothetical protein
MACPRTQIRPPETNARTQFARTEREGSRCFANVLYSFDDIDIGLNLPLPAVLVAT